MRVYAVRKRRGQWAVCSAGAVTLLFESYEQALEIARTAAAVLIDAPCSCSSCRAE